MFKIITPKFSGGLSTQDQIVFSSGLRCRQALLEFDIL